MTEPKFGYSMYLSERVDELLRDGTFSEILALVESELSNEWKATPREDTSTRELIYHELHALNRINLKVSAIVQSLSMARLND